MDRRSIEKAADIGVENVVMFSCALAVVALDSAAILVPATNTHYVVAATCALVIVLLFALHAAKRKIRIFAIESHTNLVESGRLIEEAKQSRSQLEELFAMTDMLQSADGHGDAGTVLAITARRLMPDFGGALYVFNNSRDRLDLVKNWNGQGEFTPSETLLPSACWALKRGKPHINDSGSQTLECAHHLPASASIEIPMMARGNLYGLLVISYNGDAATEALLGVRRIARALADSMSLALSNIALNEKLKTQTLRDPLTGLYNRRYMEDALERAIRTAERSKSSTSVVMIDLDNFKKLNDQHGHAKGDAVLRDVAQHLVGSLRPTDVVSRYGGEELLLILPETELKDAVVKSDMLRIGIQRLSEAHQVAISASFGVAAFPGSVQDCSELMAAADDALYAAKNAGRNCVKAASLEQSLADFQPKLVV